MKHKKQYLTLTPIIHDVIKGENLAYTEFSHSSKVSPLGEYVRFEFVNQN